uniref:Retrotransposon gag domain-containing protein n=1 Tax=Peronospora matthiolae TaxID=2874970 RepID=A0AAV1TJH5_9STRA
MGVHAVSVMLEALNRDAQRATIAKFIQNELDAEREKVALLHQQGSQQAELLREQGAQQFELLRHQQAAAGGSMHSRRPETLKIDISKYRRVEDDSLLRWFVELDDAIRARRIDDGDMQVAFAQSNLAGRAKTWALGLKLHDPYAFGSLEVFKSRLRQTFEPPRAEFRARTELLKLKQGKRDVHAFAQHLRYLASSVTGYFVDEHTLINVFIYGLVDGTVKTYMLEEDFLTLGKSIAYAKQEDFSLRESQANSSNYRPLRRQETGGPEPMDLCYIESENFRSLSHKRTARYHRCQKIGHYAHECIAPNTATRPNTGRDVMTTIGQGKIQFVGPTMSLSHDSKLDRQKNGQGHKGRSTLMIEQRQENLQDS